MRALVCVAMLAGVAAAQPSAAIGLPLPSADLPIGTVVVRVIDGSVTAPHANLEVWLSVDGIVMNSKTDAVGRATFAGLKVGATVVAAISTANKSQSFEVPASGGLRVMLTTSPMDSGPTPRESSGIARPDEAAPPGTLAVRLTYNDLHDAVAKLPVYLASYAADGKVAVMTARTDAQGVARFTGLDPATAYYPLATLPRAGKADRLMGAPLLPTAEQGARLWLSGEKRASTAPPIDEMSSTPVPKGKLHVVIQGVTEPDAPIQVVDAATGKTLASAKAEKDVTLAQPAGERVLYVDALVHGEHVRSHPFLAVADRGVEVPLYAFPRLLTSFQILAEPDGVGIDVSAQVTLKNESWSPYPAPLAIPLPAGFTHAELADDASAALDAAGVTIARVLPPGDTRIGVHFLLAAGKDGKVHWDLDLPHGTFESSFAIANDPGVAIVGAPTPAVDDGLGNLAISPISILPKLRMSMGIELPKLTAAQARVALACRGLRPDRHTALRGKPMPDFTATELDGKPLKLSSLRGKLVLVNFMATWDMLSGTERPTFAPLAAALGKELAIVLVASDGDRAEVARKVGANPPFRVVLDPPTDGNNIGPITTSWGTHLLPESYLVDKHGVVRLYLSSSRDWSTPDARACLSAVAVD